MEVEVVIEVPTGSRNKYEMDHETGHIHLDRQLFTSTVYPTEYGFIEGTEADDGDPLDALVVVNDPTFPGCRIRCRPIAVFWMWDENGPDAKVLSVPVWERRRPWTDIRDVPQQLLLEIRHFFSVYKDLEEGKWTRVGEWEGKAVAERQIEEARARYASMHAGSR
jgi:inorganic pyrophosphatase